MAKEYNDSDYAIDDPSELRSRSNKKIATERKLRQWAKRLDRHWGKWRREARECFELVAGRSWTEEERLAMADMNRMPVEFNRTLPLIKAVVGAEIAGRLRVDYKPRTTGDTEVNEILTSGAEWVRDECDAGAEESRAFFNALVCGLGYTEGRLDFEQYEDGKIWIDEVDPLQMDFDPSSRKMCALDKRYIRRQRPFDIDTAEEKFGDAVIKETEEGLDPRDSSFGITRDRNDAYLDDDEEDPETDPDVIMITEFQWYELEQQYMVVNPMTRKTMLIEPEQFKKLQELAEQEGRAFEYAETKMRCYYRAFLRDGKIISKIDKLPFKRFTYNVITGDYDNNRKMWFGLARPMMDPQKWANRFFSNIMHILKTNAKGGVMAERGAFENQAEFEESWAAADAVTIVEAGSLAANRIKDKPMGRYPAGMERLMESSITSIREVAGINPEFMGQVERNQPGVLEQGRKRAAYGIMATFFDSHRRHRKESGGLLLHLIAHLPPGTLIRVAKDDWQGPQYIEKEQMALDMKTQRYDVQVSEAPSGPNAKERTFQVMLQLLPMVKDVMPREIWLEVLEYSPLPTAMVDKIKKAVMESQGDPMEELQKQAAMHGLKLDLADKAARTEKTQAEAHRIVTGAHKDKVEAALLLRNPDPNPQVVM